MPKYHPDVKKAFLERFQVARNIKKANHGTPLIMFNSAKNKASIYANSHNEKWSYTILEWDDHVVGYVSQPFSVKYFFNGKNRVYTPDLLVKYRDNTYKFWELKDSNGVKSQGFNLKFPVLQKHFRENIGYELDLLIREKELPGQAVTNIEILRRYRSVPLNQEMTNRLLSHLGSKEFTFAEVLERAKSLGLDSVYLCALMGRKKLTFDLSQPLSPFILLQAA